MSRSTLTNNIDRKLQDTLKSNDGFVDWLFCGMLKLAVKFNT